jgi:nitrate/nitrite transporter NarK
MSGIGTAVISLINPWIISSLPNHSWRLYCVVLSVMTLALAFFGYLFKPLKPSKKQIDEVRN